jgi:hypothetical protein
MKRRLASFCVAAAVVALAAWLVHWNNQPLPADAAQPITSDPQASKQEKPPEKHHQIAYKGLDYLVKRQFADGHWEGDGGRHPVFMTGLVGVALLMEQEGPQSALLGRRFQNPATDAKLSASIRKAADWLMDQSRSGRDGLIFSAHPSETARYMEGHGLATLFLAGACRGDADEARRKRLRDVLTRAVAYIRKAQSSQGGWYHTSRAEGHDFAAIAPTAIQIQALQAAENAGIAIPGGAIPDGLQYLKSAIEKVENAGPEQSAARLADIAAMLACSIDTPRRGGGGFPPGGFDFGDERSLKFCQAEIPVGRNTRFGRDELAHYYFAQTLSRLGGDRWDRYRTAMFDFLHKSQNADGSWPSSEGLSVGAEYATALWCIVLQLDKESHPSRSLDLMDITKAGESDWRQDWPGFAT